MTTVEKIFLLIRENNLNANILAKELNFGNSQFTSWKNGISKPNVEALCKIADYFNVSIDYLLGREEKDIKKEPTLTVSSSYDEETGYIEKNKQPLFKIDTEPDNETKELIKIFTSLPTSHRLMILGYARGVKTSLNINILEELKGS